MTKKTEAVIHIVMGAITLSILGTLWVVQDVSLFEGVGSLPSATKFLFYLGLIGQVVALFSLVIRSIALSIGVYDD